MILNTTVFAVILARVRHPGRFVRRDAPPPAPAPRHDRSGRNRAGASAVGTVACCAHHVADLAPIIGASGAAVFLIDYRVPIMAIGIVINAFGVLLAARRLRCTPLPALPGK